MPSQPIVHALAHPRTAGRLLANARFDVALRAQPLDLKRVEQIIAGPSRGSFAQLSAGARQTRVDDIVRAAMGAPAGQRKAVLGLVSFLLAGEFGAASAAKVVLLAARFARTPGDISAVLCLDAVRTLPMRCGGLRQLFTLLIARIAVTGSAHVRAKMRGQIRGANAALGRDALSDIEAMILARPPDGRLPVASEHLIDEFRVRSNDETCIPSSGDIVGRRRLHGDVRQIAYLAYWLECLGHPGLPQLAGLPAHRRWSIIEDHAADLERFADDVEAGLMRFADKVKPIRTEQDVASALELQAGGFRQGSLARRRSLLQVVGAHVSRMPAAEQGPSIAMLRHANGALAPTKRVDVETYWHAPR
jgi:hypothetical protein